ncbi:hypothetical protein Krac_0103 [Ktedonobacter racemifer DSM 44963]|uniref:Uncharacterized protein n=1 Tax=Ktedonobacter racemifer DSM 44963 TaxID=485913 RepID=D6U8R5_KTERA|nr:hypothetical protein Krac_0103 [Ktedonobacter racemifer DSM 44963]
MAKGHTRRGDRLPLSLFGSGSWLRLVVLLAVLQNALFARWGVGRGAFNGAARGRVGIRREPAGR